MELINLLVAYVCWKFAVGNFEEGRDSMGWFNIVASAANAASFAASVF